MGFTIDSLTTLHMKETNQGLKESIQKVRDEAINTLQVLVEEGQMFLRHEQMKETIATKLLPPRLEDTKSKSSGQSSYMSAAEKGAKNSKDQNSSSKRQCDDTTTNSSKRQHTEDSRRWEKPKQRDEVSTSRQIPPESDEDVAGAIIWNTPKRRCIHRYACTQGFDCAFAHNEREYDWFYEPVYQDYVESKDKKVSAEFLEQLAINRKKYATKFARQIHRHVSNSYNNEVRHGRGGGTSRGGSSYRNHGGGNYERSSSISSRDH